MVRATRSTRKNARALRWRRSPESASRRRAGAVERAAARISRPVRAPLAVPGRALRRSRAASNSEPDGRGRFLLDAIEDLAIFLTWHRDNEVDAVLDRPAQACVIRIQLAWLTGATSRVAEVPARTGIRRCDQHEIRWIRHSCTSAGDGDRVLLQWLPQRFEMLARELTHFVHEQDASMREADFSGLREPGATTDQSGARDAVMWRAKWRPERGRRTFAQGAPKRVDRRDLEGCVIREVRKQRWKRPREHGFARSRRAEVACALYPRSRLGSQRRDQSRLNSSIASRLGGVGRQAESAPLWRWGGI